MAGTLTTLARLNVRIVYLARGILPFRLDSVWLRTGQTKYKDFWFRTNTGQLKYTRLSTVTRLVSLARHKWKFSLLSSYPLSITPPFDDSTRPFITLNPFSPTRL